MYSTDSDSKIRVGKPNKFEKVFLRIFQGFHRFSFSKIRINWKFQKFFESVYKTVTFC